MLSDDQVKQALSGELIDIKEVPCQTMQLSPCLLDENVNWKAVQKDFTEGAWMIISNLIHSLTENPNWACGVCGEDLGHSNSVVCESCLTWCHFKCVGLSNALKKTNWFCRFCYAKSAHTSENKVSIYIAILCS